MSKSTDVTTSRKTGDEHFWRNAVLRRSGSKQTAPHSVRFSNINYAKDPDPARLNCPLHYASAGDACALEGGYQLPAVCDGMAATVPVRGVWTIRRLQLALTLLAIGLVAWIVDWAQIVELWRAAQPSLMGVAAAAFAADRLLMGYKWRLLLRAQGVRLPLWECWGLIPCHPHRRRHAGHDRR